MRLNRVIRAILTLVAVVATQSASAQLKTSYFMEGSYFRTDLNPALVPTRGYLALSPISGYTFGSYSNFASYDNFHFVRDNKVVDAYSPLVSTNDFISQLPNRCVQTYNLDFNLFKVGFYTLTGTFWNIGSTLRLTSDATLPREYFEILKSYSPNTITAENIRMNGDLYIENFVGRTFRIDKHITVGARVKFLIGLSNISLKVDKLTTSNYKYTTSGYLRISDTYYNSEQYDGMSSPEIMEGSLMSEALKNLSNFGGAIDLGVEMRLLDNHLKVSGAITDLGFIHWSKNDMKEGTLKVTYNNKNDIDNIYKLAEEDAMDMPRHFSGYTTRLTTKVNLGAEFNFLHNHFALGALSETRFLHGGVMTELTASFNVRPTNWISLSVSHTLFSGNHLGTYGAAVNIHPRAVNIFFGVDYIPSNDIFSDAVYGLISPLVGQDTGLKSNSYNFFIGVGFNFNRPDFLINQ